MGRLNDIVNGDGELTNKETAEILKILLTNYYLVRMWKINPDEGTIYTLAISKAIKTLEHAENNETNEVELRSDITECGEIYGYAKNLEVAIYVSLN